VTKLRDIELFNLIVKCGSLSAAARELRLSPGLVSRRLVQMEAAFGVRLLQRTTRRLIPTEAGAGLYERTETILAALKEAEDFVASWSGQARGLLRVSAPTTFGRKHIAPHLKRFFDEEPFLRLELDLSDSYVDLVASGFDVAVRIGALEDSLLIAQKLAPVRRVICAAPEYLEKNGEPTSLDDLNNHRVFATALQTPWLLDGPDGSLTFSAGSFIQTNSSEVVRELVISGGGIALRSTWDVSEELVSGRLKVILPQYEGSRRLGIFALQPSRQFVSPKARVFIKFLQRLYGAHPYWEKGLPI
jgi:DNA-binding transcriptional LysR family regulator